MEDLVYWKEQALDFLIQIKTVYDFQNVDAFRRNLLLRMKELTGCDDIFFIIKEDEVSERITYSNCAHLEGTFTETSFLKDPSTLKQYAYHEKVKVGRSHFLKENTTVIYIPLFELHVKGSIILVWNSPFQISEGTDYFFNVCITRLKEVLKLNYMIFSLEELRIKFNAVFHSVSQALIFIDETDNTAWINSKAKEILGIYSENEVLSPIVISEYMRMFRENAINENEITAIATELFKDPEKEINNWLWKFKNSVFKVSSKPIITERKKGRLWMFEDISEIYFANQRLAENNEEFKAANDHLSEQNALILFQNEEIQFKNNRLEEINQEKNGLINIVSHDLKSPFQQIQGMAQVIEMIAPLEGDQKVFIDNIKAVSKKGLNLVKDILDISAIEQQKTNKQEEVIDLQKFLAKEIKICQTVADKKNIKIHLIYESQYSELYTDPEFLRRILDNLISNAVKFSYTEKNIYLHVTSKNDKVIISIKDEGQGMTELDKQHLFEKFKKLSARPTAGESSTGLGLSIVKLLVEQLNGTITCESEWGHGTTFILEFNTTEVE
ncbi:sensor histidine kinase [Sporocytophaga myxococcoides]|uniref:sensor histidine kinase n=1 Tax=Sporocytophaga myxococcoides TaxID=153721 RepID=UPI000402A47B|nr:HAMP domain-containing sensor histidine kinase [Sporocytophaga myxococcoides]